jgi:hypothetical protein
MGSARRWDCPSKREVSNSSVNIAVLVQEYDARVYHYRIFLVWVKHIKPTPLWLSCDLFYLGFPF